MKEAPDQTTFKRLYQLFSTPLTKIDCGQKCGPHNDYGVPVCCDIHQVVPSAYQEEWIYLESETNLWMLWDGSSTMEGKELLRGLESGQVPLQCLGHQECQRQFRTITCRAFPFLPYFDLKGEFFGFSFYPDFQDRCWIISNLSRVTLEYKKEFLASFQEILKLYPMMRENYQDYSDYLRSIILSDGFDLIVLDFNDRVYRIDPTTGAPQETTYDDLPSFGPYKISKDLKFPDEIDHKQSGRGN
jgi:hypothetical protein